MTSNARSLALPLLFWLIFCFGATTAGPLVAQATAPGLPARQVPPQETLQPELLQEVKNVSRAEYLKTVDEFKRAFVAAEEARQRLASRQPSSGQPDTIDCSFHPWHRGCQNIFLPWGGESDVLFRRAVLQKLDSPIPTASAQRAALPSVSMWGVLLYAIKFTACLVEADGGHDGLEGPDGLKKVGKCVTGSLLVESGKWTPWLNQDSPSGVGDYELLANFTKNGQACSSPRGIECQTTGGVDWQKAGQVYACTMTGGGVCRNSDQPRGSNCLDYRVRFLCP